MQVETDISIALLCSMRTGGVVKTLFCPESVPELVTQINTFRNNNQKFLLFGNCSNVVFPDSVINTPVILTTRVNSLSLQNNTVNAECGASLSALCGLAAENSLSGAEFAFGIPGSVGGAVFMNAGAYGGEIADILISADLLSKSGEVITLTNKELEFSYRASALQNSGDILLSALFGLDFGESESIKQKMSVLMQKRRDKQPLNFPSCGSAFKRPKDGFAGALIESCGLKGFSIGGAQVSEKHAGFIINRGNAASADIKALVNAVQTRVFEQTGIKLEPEILFVPEEL